MLRNNLTQMLASIFLLFAFGANAQTVLWGTGHSNPTIDSLGQFAIPFNQPGSWQAVSNFEAAIPACNQSVPGDALWTRSLTGRSQGAYATNMVAMSSPTVSNGAAIFDSDYLDNNGTAGAGGFNTGTAPAGYTCNPRVGHRGEIQSPSFDLTGYTDSTITLRAYLYYRPFTLTEMSFGFSTDGGTNWTDFDLDQLTPTNSTFPTTQIDVPLYGVLDGVTNLSNCKIRFLYEGIYYYMMVDDVQIIVTPDYDFGISGQTDGNTLGDAFTTTYTSDYRYSPYTQQDVSNFFFTARILNNGAKPILPANNARIELLVEKDVQGTWTQVFSANIPVDTVLPGDMFTPNEQYLANINFIDTFGTYRGTIIAAHDLADGFSLNDTVRHTFDITEREFSKCRKATDGSVFANRRIFPGVTAGNVVTEFEYGSMFYVPNGATDSVLLDSVNYKVYFTAPATGFTVAPINIRIYKFDDLNNDGTLDADPASGELVLVGLGFDSVTVVANAYVSRTVDIIDISTFSTLYLDNNTVYMVSIDQRDPNGLSTGSTYRAAWYGADELNYSLNAAILATPGLPPRNTAPVRTATANATTLVQVANTWNWVGFGADIQPSIRLLLKGNLNPWAVVGPPVTVFQSNNFDAGMEIFPNPTSNLLNLKVSFEQNMSNVTYILSNVNGQVIEMIGRNDIQSEVYSFDVNRLAQGIYFLTVRTNEGTETQRFIKK